MVERYNTSLSRCVIRIRIPLFPQTLELITLGLPGSKLAIDYSVWGTAERSRGYGLRYISK